MMPRNTTTTTTTTTTTCRSHLGGGINFIVNLTTNTIHTLFLLGCENLFIKPVRPVILFYLLQNMLDVVLSYTHASCQVNGFTVKEHD